MAKIKENIERLESLLNNTSNTQNLRDSTINADINEDVIEQQPLFDDDFDKEATECDAKAKSIILNAIKHIFTKDQIKTSEYIKDKLKLDITSLSGMLYQNNCSIIMQKALMEEIRRGASSPRHFEVFAGLSKTIAENNKQLLQTVEAIKSTYIGIRSDIQEKEQLQLIEGDSNKLLSQGNNEQDQSGITSNGGYTGNSSKDMIKELAKIARKAKEETFTDVEEIK